MATVDLVVGGTTSKVPVLDSNGRVLPENLPVTSVSTPPVWRVVNGVKSVGTWYTNDSNNVLFLNLRTASSTSASRFLNVRTRVNSTGTIFHQRSTAISGTTERWIQMLAVVPPGWEYMVDTFGGSTTANVEFWHEMS